METVKNLYTYAKDRLLSGLTLTVHTDDGSAVTCPVSRERENGSRVILTYDTPAFEALTVTADFGEESVLFSIDAKLGEGRGKFASQNAISLTLGDVCPDKLLSNYHDNPWWMMPCHPANFGELVPGGQFLLCQIGGRHLHFLMLCGENFRCETDKGVLKLSSGMPGLTRLYGPFLSLSAADDPWSAVEANYREARALGGLTVPLRDGRRMPEYFRGFGWCTWDSFYTGVTSEKIYEKLAEFRQKNIPVRWMIIDDGWLTVNDRMLASFSEDRAKFPEGLKAAVDRIKNEFGIEKVGVWHAFNGYWEGVDPKSPLYEQQKDNLFKTAKGRTIPSPDPEKAFRFWDAWHGYLADCGIDFLKVDNQSSNSGIWEGTCPTAQGCRLSHGPIERSIEKHFGGTVINCMGMDMENVQARPMSAVSRNSDDFFPRRERGFIKHLTQNVHNAVWHQQTYYCDFDMWWSDHESAVQSGVLRAISGSPIYVSDEIGKSCAAHIMPVVDDDGSVMLCDFAARPTSDCLYRDCSKDGGLLNVWNRSGDAFALAAFNVTDGEVTGTVDFNAIPGLRTDVAYVAYEYFSETYIRIDTCRKTDIRLDRDGVAVWSIYPVTEVAGDGGKPASCIMMGSPDKYVPIASPNKRRRFLTDIFS